MKPLLFIHIGTHKTGSTAIQKTFRAGVPGVACLEFHGDIAAADWGPEETRKLAEQFQRQAAAAPGQRYLLSSEGFSGDPLKGYANACVIASRLRQATGHFEVKIVVFLRRQDDFIESMYTQMIHQGGSVTFQDFLQTIQPESMNWHRLLETYAAEFGRENIIARRYHQDFYPKPESILIDFCRVVGVAPEGLKEKVAGATPNQGYSREALNLALLCNPHLDAAGRKQLRRLLQKVSPKPVFQNYSYMSIEDRRQILAACAESNAAVVRDYFDGQGIESLFPEPAADASATSDGRQGAEVLTPVLVKMLLETLEAQRSSRILRVANKLERLVGGVRRGLSSLRG